MNILLIDSIVRNYEIFNSAANANTIPIVYSSSTSTTEDILSAIRALNQQTIARIGLVFEIKEPRQPTLFLDNAPFFKETDIAEAGAYSANVAFLINLITEFQVAHIDFLACNSLNQPAWVNYYAFLTTATGVIVGASNDNTGNIQYGGDWIMESTSQDIELIYFTPTIENYASLLLGGATGWHHSVVIKNDGNIYGTGINNFGQLGLGNSTSTYNTLQQMLPIAGKTPKYISCGGFHTIVLMTDGTVYGTGYNFFGSLGLDNYTEYYITLQPMLMPSGKIAKYIACGVNHTIVLMTDGTVYGTGLNTSGQLGLGNYTTNYDTLQLMNTPSVKVKYIACTSYSTFVLMKDGKVYGTGYNGEGELGLGNYTTNYNTLQQMLPIAGKTPTYISCGGPHTIVLMTDGAVYGTGYNFFGSLGLGNSTEKYNTLQLMQMPNGVLVQSISAGGGFTLVLMTDGTVYGTGRNNYNQLGDGTYIDYNTLHPMSMIGGKLAKYISAGDSFTLVLMTDGMVYGTGENYDGQIGTSDYTDILTLQPMLNGDNVIGPFSLLDLYNSIPCFKADTKILTKNGYKPVQELRKGDMIKTLRDGYKPIVLIGKRDIYHDANANANANITDVAENKNSLYRCSLQNYPELFEELVITGAHAILVDKITALQRGNIINVLSKIYSTDGKFRLPACVDERATLYEKSGTYTIYHLALEHDNNVMNYGIYANGLLVETCSQRYLNEYSGMTLL